MLPYRLSDEALEIIDTQLDWLVTGNLRAEAVLADIRAGLLELG